MQVLTLAFSVALRNPSETLAVASTTFNWKLTILCRISINRPSFQAQEILNTAMLFSMLTSTCCLALDFTDFFLLDSSSSTRLWRTLTYAIVSPSRDTLSDCKTEQSDWSKPWEKWHEEYCLITQIVEWPHLRSQGNETSERHKTVIELLPSYALRSYVSSPAGALQVMSPS